MSHIQRHEQKPRCLVIGCSASYRDPIHMICGRWSFMLRSSTQGSLDGRDSLTPCIMSRPLISFRDGASLQERSRPPAYVRAGAEGKSSAGSYPPASAKTTGRTRSENREACTRYSSHQQVKPLESRFVFFGKPKLASDL